MVTMENKRRYKREGKITEDAKDLLMISIISQGMNPLIIYIICSLIYATK